SSGPGGTPDAATAGLGPAGVVPGTVEPSATGTTGSVTATGNPVLDQVLEGVPRLVQRGDGTSRLTLKLHPADLGEVHVTVSVKAGVVDVTLAAGAQAREALGSGSEHLRVLLERLGHTSGHVTLRDLASGGSVQPGAAPQSGQSWGQGTQPDAHGHPQHDLRQDVQGSDAWTGDRGSDNPPTGSGRDHGGGSGRGAGDRPGSDPGSMGAAARLGSRGSAPTDRPWAAHAGLDVTV
ncbi:MAG: flagellar hook-length control protein FliK, partial [Nocardioidaceae bacterium]